MIAKRYLCTSVTLLILMFLAVFGITFSVDAQKVHALLVIMNDDLDIRQIVDVNRLRVRKMLQLLEVNPDIWQADDRQIQPHHISEWVRNRQVDAEDTILVYYSGHGHIDRKARHYLDLDVQNAAFSLLRSDLAEELSEKRCRLKMLITDTCSNRVQTSPPIAQSAGTVVSRKRRYTQDIFLKHKGFLDITAASPGQYAWGNNEIGGYFTAALIESFTASADTDKNGFLSWEEVFLATRDETQRLFSETTFDPFDKRKMDNIGQKTQTPKEDSLPKMLPLTVISEPSHSRGIVLFGHEYSREEVDAIIFMGIIFGSIVFILVFIYSILSIFKKGKKTEVNETTERNSTSKNNLSASRLRRSEHRLSMVEEDLRKQLKRRNISQQQKEDLKKQLKETLTQLEKNVRNEMKNTKMGQGRREQQKRRLANIRKKKRNIK